jgi:hypothetical protein
MPVGPPLVRQASEQRAAGPSLSGQALAKYQASRLAVDRLFVLNQALR